MDRRLEFIEIQSGEPAWDMSAEVLTGLSKPQKELPSKLFYDQAGSELFEQITELPEYYLTRCERSILESHAAEIISKVGQEVTLIEFGSGSSVKTRLLIEAALRRQPDLRYVPIDISKDFLRGTAESLLDLYPGLRITALAIEYFAAIGRLPSDDRPRLILFLGSNIGNFDPEERHRFLTGLQAQLRPQDRLLIGIDLIKDPAIIEPAYNDAQGVTAAFNKNILAHINQALEANFDLDCFEHRAPFLPEEGKIEMRLVSLVDQRVCINAVQRPFMFKRGEFIHTENSQKFTPEGFAKIANEANLSIKETWQDQKNWFALTLLATQ